MSTYISKSVTPLFVKVATGCAALALFMVVGVSGADAATLQLSPSSGSHAVGSTFSATVMVNSGSQQVNAAEATLSFDSSVLSVVNVSQAGSVLSLWTTEPTFSNTAGTIQFGGGNPSPFTGNSNLMTVTFRVNAEGSGSVTFDSGGVTAADGTGRNILSTMSPATYTGTGAPEPEPTPEPTPDPAPTVGTPSSPLIASETHPESGSWYNERVAEFSWSVPSGVTAVRLLVGRQAEATPTVVYEPPIDSRTLDEDILDEDGVWYFHIQYRNSAGWGEITHYRFGIDTEAPEAFDIEVVDGEGTPTPTLSFATEDELSGVAEYEVRIADRDPIIISSEEHDEDGGQFTVSDPLPEGEVMITVLARDRAGNEMSSEITVTVEESDDEPVITTEPDEDREGFFSRYGTNMFIFLLILIIAGLVGYIWRLRKQVEESKKRGKDEVREVRNEIERVFSALRDEAEDLFASFDGKKGLSAKEKEAFKKIEDAINVSEEIIGKEVDDVDKLMS